MAEPTQRATLSVAIITFNEEENIGRTLASVKDIADEIIVVDSGSTDRTVEIAKQFGAKVFIERWKGFAAQKNSTLDKCTSEWILSLDADEEVSEELASEVRNIAGHFWGDVNEQRTKVYSGNVGAARIPRKNYFLGKWIRHGGFFPDRKLRMIRRGAARFEKRAVHEDMALTHDAVLDGVKAIDLHGAISHYQYLTLTSYIEHMNRYSSLGAEMVIEKRSRVGFSLINIILRPIATFFYNYFFRLGFLDGKEGLLLHLYHSVYVSWKYAKAWEMSRKKVGSS